MSLAQASRIAFRRPSALCALHLPTNPLLSDDSRRKVSSPLTSNLSNLSYRSYLTRTAPNLLVRRTQPAESVAVAGALVSVAVLAQAAKYGLDAYNEYQASKPAEPEAPAAGEEPKEANGGAKGGKKEKRENIFTKFGFAGPSKFYDGGFDESMTRSEAALILGVRESATAKRIKDAHRTILIANHPDTGGSNFIASKVNEAKELLLKGKDGDKGL
jgi:hypothetical protein